MKDKIKKSRKGICDPASAFLYCKGVYMTAFICFIVGLILGGISVLSILSFMEIKKIRNNGGNE